MSDSYDDTPIKVTPSTANNGVTVYLNTTYGDGTETSTGIGEHRGLWINHRLVWALKVTGQNITLSARKLINGAWEQVTTADFPLTLTNGDVTITASSTVQATCSWLLPWDVCLYSTNGAAGPTINSWNGYLTNNPNPGV